MAPRSIAGLAAVVGFLVGACAGQPALTASPAAVTFAPTSTPSAAATATLAPTVTPSAAATATPSPATTSDEGGVATLVQCIAADGLEFHDFGEDAPLFSRLQAFLDANGIDVLPIGVGEAQAPGLQVAVFWVFDDAEEAETFAETFFIIPLPPVGLAPQTLLFVRSKGTVVVAASEDFSSSRVDALLECA